MVESNSKKCSLCNETKCFDLFPKSKKGKLKSYCKACDALAQRRYRDRVGKEVINSRRRQATQNDPLVNRNYNLRQKYGITVGEWTQRFESQGKLCAMCKTDTPRGRGWQTDHDHKTGVIRGILCHHCNSLLGHAKDSIDILNAAIIYLTK